MELTQRAKDIILLLAEQPVGYPLTLGILSEQLKLSRRTIQRVLPEIRAYMQKNGYHLEAKAGSGLYLDESDSVRQAILKELHDTKEQNISLRGQLLRILLEHEGIFKIDGLCQQLECSRDTTEKELSAVRVWLERYHIQLCSQSGVGIYLQWDEENLRTARIEYMVEFYDSDVMSQLSSPDAVRNVYPLAQLMTSDEVPKLLKLLKQAQEWSGSQLVDEGFLRIFLCVALTIQRIRQKNPLKMPTDKQSALRLLSEYAVAEYVADAVQNNFSVTLSEDDTAFLAMYWANSDVVSGEMENFGGKMNLIYLTHQLIVAVEQQLHVNLQEDDALLNGLCSHLQAACSRLTIGTPMEHPMLEEIQNSYPELFLAVQKACEILRDVLHISIISDSEMAYIAMHFGAALEKLRAQQQNLNAVVICPTGVGSANRLAAELQRTYPQISVRAQLSAVEIDTHQLKADGIDLIISTIDLNIPFQAIRVNPILTERDHVLLKAVMDTILRKKEQKIRDIESPMRETSVENVQFIARYSEELIQLTNNISWQQIPLLQSWEEISYYAAHMMTADAIAANDIEMQLSVQKQPAEVYICPFRCTFLKCRTEYVSHCRLGYLHFKTPYQNGEMCIEGSLVILIPSNDKTQACDSLSNKVSTILLRNAEYFRLLREGHNVQVESLLRKELLKGYQTMLEQTLE